MKIFSRRLVGRYRYNKEANCIPEQFWSVCPRNRIIQLRDVLKSFLVILGSITRLFSRRGAERQHIENISSPLEMCFVQPSFFCVANAIFSIYQKILRKASCCRRLNKYMRTLRALCGRIHCLCYCSAVLFK